MVTFVGYTIKMFRRFQQPLTPRPTPVSSTMAQAAAPSANLFLHGQHRTNTHAHREDADIEGAYVVSEVDAVKMYIVSPCLMRRVCLSTGCACWVQSPDGVP